MRVSALIPTYNRRQQVADAIDSVLAQSLPVHEIIVVDDGSEDGTAGAIRSRYGPSVIVFRQDNAGVSAARNQAIRMAQGEWIAFLDSDDVWLPTKIERQIETLTRLGDEFGVCFTDCVPSGDPDLKLSVFRELGFEHSQSTGPLNEPTRYIITGRDPFWPQSLLIRRSLLDESGYFDEGLVIREDTDLTFRLSFRTKFCFVAEPLVRFDRTPSRAIGLSKLYASRSDQKYDCLEKLYTKWLHMPEVIGTVYETPIRGLLRDTYYSSAEAKIHEFRIGAALRTISRLKEFGDSHKSIAATLLLRKIAKLRRCESKAHNSAMVALPHV